MKLISEYGNEIVETDDINKIERLKSLNFREVAEVKIKEIKDDKESKEEKNNISSSKKTQNKKVNPSTKGRSKKNGNKKEA